MDWSKMQAEHREWVDRMYPEQPPVVPATGMVEEAGELLHAALKMEQRRLWGAEGRYSNLMQDLIDAVGDCAIYACSWCNAVGVGFVVPGFASADDRSLLQLGIDLVKCATDFVESPHASTFDTYLRLLRHVCHRADLSFEESVRVTWAKVRRRTKDPKPVVVCLCGSTRFRKLFEEMNHRETLLGHIVLSVGCFQAEEYAKPALDVLHKRKIDMAQEVLVLDGPRDFCINCGVWECAAHGGSPRPYIGESTASEVEYAVARDKRMRYWSKEQCK